MKKAATVLLALLAASYAGVAATSPADAFTSAATKSVAYGGLVFNIPKTWSVYTAIQTEPCGVPTPAVIIGDGKAASSPCNGTPQPLVSTLVHIVPTGGSQPGYASAAGSHPSSSSPYETDRTRTFTHDGVRVLLTTSLFSGRVVGSPTTVPPTIRVVWTVEAYFKGYRVAFIAGSAGGTQEGSLDQAIAAVESVHPGHG